MADEKSGALEALQRASGEKEAQLQSEISQLNERLKKDEAELEKALKEVKHRLVSIDDK